MKAVSTKQRTKLDLTDMTEAHCEARQEALNLIEQSIGVVWSRADDMKDDAPMAAITLMKVAHQAVTLAMEGRTVALLEAASCCLSEVRAVLRYVANDVNDDAMWGALSLIKLSKKTLDSTIGDPQAVTA